MALVKLAALSAALVLAVAGTAHAGKPAVVQWRAYSSEASARFGIPVDWIERVMAAESAGQTTVDGRPIRSRKGAMGLMQLMPATWLDMRVRLGLGTDPDDPRDNIRAGAFYLRLLYDRFGYPGLFAAYNAGPARYAAYLTGVHALPSETMAYLANLTGSVGTTEGRSVSLATPRPTLFAVRRDGGERHEENGLASLFAVRSQGE